jgi:hypothetical protein
MREEPRIHLGRLTRIVVRFGFAIDSPRRTDSTDSTDRMSTKGRKMHEVVLRHRFDRVPGFAPGCQATDDHEGVETLFSEEVRHTGARGFALSSAVEVDVFVFRKPSNFDREIVGLNPNRPPDPVGTGVVVTVTADVDQ